MTLAEVEAATEACRQMARMMKMKKVAGMVEAVGEVEEVHVQSTVKWTFEQTCPVRTAAVVSVVLDDLN